MLLGIVFARLDDWILENKLDSFLFPFIRKRKGRGNSFGKVIQRRLNWKTTLVSSMIFKPYSEPTCTLIQPVTAKRQMMELITRDKWKVKMSVVWCWFPLSALTASLFSFPSLPLIVIDVSFYLVRISEVFDAGSTRDATGPFDRWLTAEGKVAWFFCFLAEMSACVLLPLAPTSIRSRLPPNVGIPGDRNQKQNYFWTCRPFSWE